MSQQFECDSAARVMVEALYIAATQDKETAVADYLEAQLHQGSLTLVGLQQHFQLLQTSRTCLFSSPAFNEKDVVECGASNRKSWIQCSHDHRL
jgi:hypothetical protein